MEEIKTFPPGDKKVKPFSQSLCPPPCLSTGRSGQSFNRLHLSVFSIHCVSPRKVGFAGRMFPYVAWRAVVCFALWLVPNCESNGAS